MVLPSFTTPKRAIFFNQLKTLLQARRVGACKTIMANTTNNKTNNNANLVKISDARAQMKEQKGSINQAILALLSYYDTCADVRKVVYSKEFAKTCAQDIYTAMHVGEEYTVNTKKKNEAGEEYTEQVTRIRKPSADLCLRWFVANQVANKTIYENWTKKQQEKKNGKK